MSRPFPDRGAPRTLTVSLPTDLTATQAAAVIELLDELRDTLWAHYEVQVLDIWREERVTQFDVPLTDPPF